MNIKIIGIILLALVIATGIILGVYNRVPKSFPADLEIEHRWGACHAEKGWYVLSISATGNATLNIKKGFEVQQKDYNFTEDEILTIYRQIVKSDFFKLDERYHDTDIVDGSCSNLRVIADSQEHTVSVSNQDVKAIDDVAQKLFNILESKDSNWQTIE